MNFNDISKDDMSTILKIVEDCVNPTMINISKSLLLSRQDTRFILEKLVTLGLIRYEKLHYYVDADKKSIWLKYNRNNNYLKFYNSDQLKEKWINLGINNDNIPCYF